MCQEAQRTAGSQARYQARRLLQHAPNEKWVFPPRQLPRHTLPGGQCNRALSDSRVFLSLPEKLQFHHLFFSTGSATFFPRRPSLLPTPKVNVLRLYLKVYTLAEDLSIWHSTALPSSPTWFTSRYRLSPQALLAHWNTLVEAGKNTAQPH